MESRFDPQSYESKWQREWAERGWFRAETESSRPSFCIMIPPPNVTGKLHMGHALQSTLQDLLTRWRRMQGYNALWLPGTDHAGIATQLMVERELAAEGLGRVELGRERFLERMWTWKDRYQGNIRRQLVAMGSSCDFSRERFTLDPGMSRAVSEAFVRLYREGKIYRGEYLVNWSPGLDTAISDLEVEMRSVRDKLWHISYDVKGGDEKVVVATTRPETMLGDTALAYHPGDERFAGLAGRRAVIPIVGREIPFVADEAVEQEFGTGLVKVTPFHDPADFEIARRHSLLGIQVIDRRGRMTAAAGEGYAGLSVDEGRARLVDQLRASGHLVREEDYVHNVGFCQRSGVRVEPLVSTQWFCNVDEMAELGLAAWREGRLSFIPESWGKTWEHWLANIRPWCISRQLWWGHQIPAWYDERGNIFVAHDADEAARLAGTDRLTRDPDVLDTWFSSGLWPFSTLGWPEATPDYRTFYPTSVLITGFDILFFWVARMVMMGLHLTGESPFGKVHLTGLVRDAEGQKMSKTKGNVLDPEELIAEYGADAMRFTLAQLDSPGRDIPLDASRMAGYRAFGNKIWNATRFVLLKAEGGQVRDAIDSTALELPERWILARLSETARIVEVHLEDFRFDLACHELYQFFWSDYCDWYVEMSKPGLAAESSRPGVADVLVTVLDRALRLLHPVMPHLTEELWQRLPGHDRIHPDTICLAPYPRPEKGWELAERDYQRVDYFQQIVTWMRGARADQEAAAPERRAQLKRAKLFIEGNDLDSPDSQWNSTLDVLLRILAGFEELEGDTEIPEGSTRHRIGTTDVAILFPDLEEVSVDFERVNRQLSEVEANIARVRARLDNPGFLAKAPEAVVEGARRQLAELEAQERALRETLGAAEIGDG